jgi:hypothetical protein
VVDVGPWLAAPIGGEIVVGRLVVSLAANGSRLIRWIPQAYMRGALTQSGWAVGTMRASSAARGGWSRTLGRGPDVRVQWTAPGGRHGGAQYKVTGPALGTIKRRYFFSINW